MGTKLPSGAADDQYAGDYHSTQKWFLEKRAWQVSRAGQSNLTADVLRYTTTGGSAAYMIEPTYTLVAGLSGLEVYVDTELKRYEKKFGAIMEEGDRVFVFYDVTGGVTVQDRIDYDGDRYDVQGVDHNPRSGRIEVLGRLSRSDV